MKKIILVLAILWSAPALAQNPTCPTRPPGDSTNACASTAFVTRAIALLSNFWVQVGGGPDIYHVGKVGINATVPTNDLDVSGTIRLRDYTLGTAIVGSTGVVNVQKEYYGLNYSVVCDGATDTTSALAAAITAASATGGDVLLPYGKCMISSTLTLPEGVVLKGQGAGAALTGTVPVKIPTQLFWTGNNVGPIITFAAGVRNAGLKDLSIDGNVANRTTSVLTAIFITEASGLTIQNVDVLNVGWGILTEPTMGPVSGTTAAFSVFRDVRFLFVRTGLYLSANFVAGNLQGGTTDNQFYNIFVYGYEDYGVNLVGLCDDNHFAGIFIGGSGASAQAAIIFNSGDPAGDAGVYSNNFMNVILDTTVGQTIIVNKTSAPGVPRSGGNVEGFMISDPLVQNTGILTWINNFSPIISVSCSVGTVNAATMVVIRGIVTHC